MRIVIALLYTAGFASAQSGPPPGGTSTAVTYRSTYTLSGGTATQSNQSYSATATDTSAVWVTNSGVLTLINPAITTSGGTSSTDSSSFVGLNAALLVTSGSASVTGGTITTTGTGASGAFAGNVVFTADSQALPGDMIADSISTIAVTLKNNST